MNAHSNFILIFVFFESTLCIVDLEKKKIRIKLLCENRINWIFIKIRYIYIYICILIIQNQNVVVIV